MRGYKKRGEYLVKNPVYVILSRQIQRPAIAWGSSATSYERSEFRAKEYLEFSTFTKYSPGLPRQSSLRLRTLAMTMGWAPLDLNLDCRVRISYYYKNNNLSFLAITCWALNFRAIFLPSSQIKMIKWDLTCSIPQRTSLYVRTTSQWKITFERLISELGTTKWISRDLY